VCQERHDDEGVTATAFTAFHPTDHEDCQEGFRSRCVRLVGTAAILIAVADQRR